MRERLPCPRCPGTMVKGSEMCRSCRLSQMKRQFRGYYARDPKKVVPFRWQKKAGK